MPTSIDFALSGLAAASKRIEVSAANIANQSNTASTATSAAGVTTNGSYIPKDIVQISLGAGGVRTETRDSGSQSVDIAKQMVDMQVASYDYKANLKSIKVAANLEQNLLDMLS